MREYRNPPDREVNRDELLLLGCFHVLDDVLLIGLDLSERLETPNLLRS